MLKIPYGLSNFERIRTKNFLYVDKTHFIEKIEAMDYIVHLRPRRFGKSLFLSMIDRYYDVESADKFDELFKGLYIYDNPTDYKSSYYILRFNFSGIENTEIGDLRKGFLDSVEDGIISFIDRYKLDIQVEESNHSAAMLRSLLRQFKKLDLPHKIYILIDEYDHFTNSLLSGDATEFLSVLTRGGFVRSFYEVIKERADSGIVERIFITGVMSVTLDSMTSGFNIASNITIRKGFSDMMGFTAEEVQELLRLSFSNPENQEEVVQLTTEEQRQIYDVFRENYNGYLFSGRSKSKVFNSTLIIYYLQHYMPDRLSPESLEVANLNQSGATIDSIARLKNHEQNYKVIEEIISEGQIDGELKPFIEIDKKFDTNDLITLLFNIGMLTIKGFDMVTQFEMPNKIIKNVYLQYLGDLIQRQSNYTLDTKQQQNAIIEVERKGDITALTALVSEFLMSTSGRNAIKFDEKYIKLIYMFLLSSTNQFSVYDEFPALQGFNDLFIQKASNSTARYEVLIELKYIKKGDTTEAKIEEEVAEGISQIEKYMKDERLAKRDNLREFVVVFSGFEPVRLLEFKNSGVIDCADSR